jgi:hypothetical protein
VLTIHHDFTITFKLDPALLALLNRWLDLKGGMTPAEVEALTDRLTAHAAKLESVTDPPSAP